jgi:hypothetical protein
VSRVVKLRYLSLSLNINIHSFITLLIGSKATHDLEVFGGQHSPSRIETNPSSFEQGKHRLHNLLYDLASHFTFRIDCALTYRSSMET